MEVKKKLGRPFGTVRVNIGAKMKETLLELMIEDVKTNDRITSCEFFKKHDIYRDILLQHYDSYIELRIKAGGSSKIKINSYSDSELLKRIVDFEKNNNRIPLMNEIKGLSTILKRFGSWNKAIELALNVKIGLTREDIMKKYFEIENNAKNDFCPTFFYKNCGITHYIVKKHFGTWEKFIKEILGDEKNGKK